MIVIPILLLSIGLVSAGYAGDAAQDVPAPFPESYSVVDTNQDAPVPATYSDAAQDAPGAYQAPPEATYYDPGKKLTDNAWNKKKRTWGKKTCRRLSVSRKCKDDGERNDVKCSKPRMIKIKPDNTDGAKYAVISCDGVDGELVHFVNGKDGEVIARGALAVEKMIKCSIYGDWIAKDFYGKWVVLKNTFCIATPLKDL